MTNLSLLNSDTLHAYADDVRIAQINPRELVEFVNENVERIFVANELPN